MNFLRYAHLLCLVVGVAVGGTFVLPLNVLAAQMYFKVVPNTVVGDEAAIVEAYIDPQGELLNVVEGVVSLQNTEAEISSVIVETGGSVLTLWSVRPEYSESDKVVRFTGGTPQGFSDEGRLFRMRIFASEPGTATISWIGGSAYLSDGIGTKDGISAHSLVVVLSRSNPNQINPASADSSPPYFDIVEIGNDLSVYEGKYFLSFHATDDISGVARYEVTEGQEVTEVTNGVYVLKDQEKNTPVFITAYDQAGNSKTIKVSLTFDWLAHGTLVVLSAVLIFVLWYVRRIFFKE